MIHLVAESGSNKDSLQEVLDFIKSMAKQVDADVSPDKVVKFQFELLKGSGLTEEQIVKKIQEKCREYEMSPIMAISVG